MGDLKYEKVKMKEKEKLEKDKQMQEYVIKERKRVMGEIGTIY